MVNIKTVFTVTELLILTSKIKENIKVMFEEILKINRFLQEKKMTFLITNPLIKFDSEFIISW